MKRFICACACLASLASAHPAAPFSVPQNPWPYFPVKSAWLGATLFGTGHPVSVYFVRSTSYWAHELDFMDPGTEAPRPLLLYRASTQGKTCPDSGGLVADLGVHGSSEELVFRLRTLAAGYAGQICTGEACGPRYTGLNNAASRFHSSGEFAHLLGTIWAEMARISQTAADSLPPPCAGKPRIPPGQGGVLVSFNDGANETYGDLIVLVTGAVMDVERNPPADSGQAQPAVPPAAGSCLVETHAGGVAIGEPFRPKPMTLPLSAIRPRATEREPRFFLDQAWRTLFPGRPDETEFPNGPEIRVAAPGPFRFDLAFFTKQGEFVNHARGQVSAEMLRMGLPLPDGRREIALMWYPASERGERVSTGAYIVKGRIDLQSSGDVNHNPTCAPARTGVLATLGYIRR